VSLTPAKRAKAEAVTTLIRLGWSPPPPNSEQAQRIIDDIALMGSDRRGLQQPRCDSLNLTDNELVVLSLLAEGHTRESVAERMHYSTATVNDYVKAVLRKLGARNTTHAVAIAYRAGDLDLRRAA
jgi:Response regulator containing a CheY-like receiver domain and an HTH DNA-binding domain